MNRRSFLKAGGSALAVTASNGLAAPAISQRAAARTLRFVPHADLAYFDPIWSNAYIARNAGLLVWDTLYGIDATLKPQRQMIEAEEVSADGLIWTFRLRPGLTFHDGERVLAKDAVASITRWAVREPMGQLIKAIENELSVVDDRTFRWVLRKPFPKMLVALGKTNTPCCFIMPARVAATDPFRQIGEYIGSGPMRFVKNPSTMSGPVAPFSWPSARKITCNHSSATTRRCGGRCLGSSPPARHSTPKKAAKSSRALAISMPQSVCWRKAAIRANPSPC